MAWISMLSVGISSAAASRAEERVPAGHHVEMRTHPVVTGLGVGALVVGTGAMLFGAYLTGRSGGVGPKRETGIPLLIGGAIGVGGGITLCILGTTASPTVVPNETAIALRASF